MEMTVSFGVDLPLEFFDMKTSEYTNSKIQLKKLIDDGLKSDKGYKGGSVSILKLRFTLNKMIFSELILLIKSLLVTDLIKILFLSQQCKILLLFCNIERGVC